MNDNDFYERLSMAIDTRKQFMIDEVLPKLKQEIAYFQMTYDSMYKTLLKNKMVSEDPFRTSIKISELQIPPKTQFPENKVKEEMSVRLSLYSSHLEFLLGMSSMSLEYLSPKRLKTLSEFVTYFDWPNLGHTSDDYNTYHLANMLKNISGQTRALTSQILQDNRNQLTKQSKSILSLLKLLSDFNREDYKFSIRSRVLSGMKVDSDRARTSPEEVATQIQKDFNIVFPNRPYYKDLVVEILREDYSTSSETLQNDLIKKLSTYEKKQASIRKPLIVAAEYLDKAIGALTPCEQLLSDSIFKINWNWSLMANKNKTSLIDKLLLFFGIDINRESEKIVNLEILDDLSGTLKTVELSLITFDTMIKRFIERVKSLTNQFTLAKKSLTDEEEEKSADDLTKVIQEFLKIAKYLDALQDYYMLLKTDSGNQLEFKSIKMELAAINNQITLIRKHRNQYESIKQEQMLSGHGR